MKKEQVWYVKKGSDPSMIESTIALARATGSVGSRQERFDDYKSIGFATVRREGHEDADYYRYQPKVRKTRMPTIYEIKRVVEAKCGYFFARTTMAFWKLKLSDFKISRTEHPDIFLIWALFKDYRGRVMGVTERYFVKDNLLHDYESALKYADKQVAE